MIKKPTNRITSAIADHIIDKRKNEDLSGYKIRIAVTNTSPENEATCEKEVALTYLHQLSAIPLYTDGSSISARQIPFRTEIKPQETATSDECFFYKYSEVARLVCLHFDSLSNPSLLEPQTVWLGPQPKGFEKHIRVKIDSHLEWKPKPHIKAF